MSLPACSWPGILVSCYKMRDRRSERGAAVYVTLIITVTVFAAAAVLLNVTLRSTRTTGEMSEGKHSEHCAEAGLVIARAAVAANRPLWDASLCSPAEEPCSEVAWLAAPAIDHELDSPPVGTDPPDFKIILRDNEDELPAPNNADIDVDNKIFIHVTCLKYPAAPVTVTELVEYNAGTLTRKLWMRTE